MEYGLPEIAKLYVKDKAGLIRLMAEKYNIGIDGTSPHKVVIGELKRLYDHDPQFRADIRDLMYKNKIIAGFNNSVGAIIGTITTAIGGAVSGVSDLQRAKVEAKAQEDAFFQQYILQKQSQNNTGKIVLISVASLGVIGLVAWLILRKK